MNGSQGPEPFGKAPDGALLRSIPFQVRRCQAVADVGVIDRSLTGNPARRKTARSSRATWLSRVAGPVFGVAGPNESGAVKPAFPTGNLLRPPRCPRDDFRWETQAAAQRDPPFPDSGRPVTIEAEDLAAFPQPPCWRFRESRRASPGHRLGTADRKGRDAPSDRLRVRPLPLQPVFPNTGQAAGTGNPTS